MAELALKEAVREGNEMKKLLASLLCVAMIVCFMPTMAFAETEAVAQVGETTYNSFREAQVAALNELNTKDSVEIKLLKDTSTATFSDLSRGILNY